MARLEEIYFAFGPNHSYYFDGPRCREYRGTPEEWNNVKEMQTVKCITMSQEGTAFRVFENPKGQTFWCTNGVFPKGVAIGPDNGYLAWSTGSSAHWRRIPVNQEANRKARDFGKFALASFGVNWAYFYLRPDGRFVYNGQGLYTTLSSHMACLQDGDIEFPALNPYYVEEFFLVLKNNTAVFRVPLSYRNELQNALAKHGITCTALTSQRAASSVQLPSATRAKGLWKGFRQSLPQTITEAVVGQVAGALVGTVFACNLM